MIPIWAEEEKDTLVGKLVITKSRREDFSLGEIQVGKIYGLSQFHGVTEVFCRSAMTGERGTNTQPIGIVTIEIATFEEDRVWSWDEWLKVGL